MTNASRPTFLRHFGRALASRQQAALADMGTAFALDEALDGRPFGAPDPDDATPAAGAVPVSPWRLWLGKKLRG